MAAFVIATVKVKNPDKFAEYGLLAGSTMLPFGGEVHLRGKFASQLGNGEDHSAGAILKFPNLQSAKDWYASPEYQQIIPIRDEGADIGLALYETLA